MTQMQGGEAEDKKEKTPVEAERTNFKQSRTIMPNILVTGTPGTGKTFLCELIVAEHNLQYINFGDLVKQNPNLQHLWNSELQCYDLTDEAEDLIMDQMEPLILQRNCIVEHIDARPFAEDWFDYVIVLTAKIEILGSRLEDRGYSEDKIKENIDSEIFGVCLERARESYPADIIIELPSESLEQMEYSKTFVGGLITGPNQ
ncbi:MAG: adenylate kinase [Streblomastix strix]|uniref:Adenylate kinase n=1 Tax=Streblomastix strix TaxID=222440 RepID=A0A5J4UHS0_9EUKA|nr:MAG: adenylate kinase [Streblomastix strix]